MSGLNNKYWKKKLKGLSLEEAQEVLKNQQLTKEIAKYRYEALKKYRDMEEVGELFTPSELSK